MEPLFARLLIPVDGSRNALKAAEYGVRLARRAGSEVLAVHVVDEENAEDLARYADQPLEDILARMRRSGEGYLEELRSLARDQGVRLQAQVRVGVPHRTLLEAAEELGADLIVIGTFGRRGPRRVLIGSVTERVIAHSRIPVMVIK